MYRVAHVDAGDLSNLLNKFKSKDGDISVYGPGNMLIITDTGAQIQRILRIVEEVDVGGAGDQLFVEPVHYASASEIANKLNEILDLKGASGGKGGSGGSSSGGGSGGSKSGPAKIVPDDRTNSLIVTSTQADYLRLLELIKRMDVPNSGEGEIHVLPLQYAGCKELSQTLNSILGRTTGTVGGVGGVGGTGARPTGTGTTGSRTGGPPVPGSTEDIFEGQIRVVCDEPSNKLVITSSLRDYAQLRNVIDQLDMPRRQVFIEAVIMDVNVDRTLNLGVAYHAGAPIASVLGSNDTVLYGGNNAPTSIAGIPSTSDLEGLAVGVRGPTITQLNSLFPGLTIPAFGVVLNALGKDGNSNVLATPHILATDNVPAQISIGQNIPLQTNAPALGSLGGLLGQAGGAAGGLGALGGLGGFGLGGFGAGRQDVGTKIKVTPHINDSDQVRLELDEEISEAGAAQGTLGAVPINKRTAETQLVVRDQQTVVIGGLVRDSIVEGQTKIPILGDLPVLGALFRHSTKTVQKTNLLLILTPYIVRNQDDLRAIFERKMQERQEFIDRYLVFSDEKEWEPPRDFSRSNGLVEDIRQSLIAEDDKLRLMTESIPKRPRTHDNPAEPIPIPQLGGRGGSAVPSAEDSGGSAKPAGGGGAPAPAQRPKLPVQAPKVDRVE
jgi:general secretion pathway protein D